MKVKIERGIIDISQTHYDEVWIQGAGHRWKLNIKSLAEREYSNNEKVMGIIIDNEFHLFHQFKLNDGREYNGYIVNNDPIATAFGFQTIEKFDINKFDPFKAEYSLGEKVTLKKANVIGFENNEEHSRD